MPPLPEDQQYDFEWHIEGLQRALAIAKGSATGAWLTVFNVYEGCCWLRAQVERDLVITQSDPDLASITEQIVLYRAWANTVGLTRQQQTA